MRRGFDSPIPHSEFTSEQGEKANFLAFVEISKGAVMFLLGEAKAKTTSRGRGKSASADLLVTDSFTLRSFSEEDSHPAQNEQDRYYFLTDDKIIQRVTFNMWFVFKKVMLITVTVFVVVILFLQLIDTLAGPATPTFHDAPQVFCEKTRFIGIALPPFGIYLCPEAKDSESTWAHELVHWDQYKSKGFVMFYVSYGLGYLESDFVYMDHPMEIEARQREAEFMRTDATSSTQ